MENNSRRKESEFFIYLLHQLWGDLAILTSISTNTRGSDRLFT